MEYAELRETPGRQCCPRFYRTALVLVLILVGVLLLGACTLSLPTSGSAEVSSTLAAQFMARPRLEPLTPATLSSAQRALYDRIVAGAKDSSGKPLKSRVNPDGSLTGPFNAMLLDPQLGVDSMDFLEDLRFGNLSIRHRVVETVILRVAFDNKCGYEFCAHRSMAKHAGVSDASIEAIRRGEIPQDLHVDQATALALTIEMNKGVGPRSVSDATYSAAILELGERGVFEVVTTVGYYVALSKSINTFRMPCANGEPDPFMD